MTVFFKPEDGWAADFIPFYWQGEYHLFYLKDYRDKANHGEGTPWFHRSTHDFVTFKDYGEALPRGTEADQDLYVFTGCALEHNGTFHIFYTGHNPHLRAAGKPEQAVMHATSLDLITWTKDPTNPIMFADPARYEPHDWRDPFVFWNSEAGEFWMLLAARLQTGPNNRRGITALAASPDLVNWEIRDPFWAPSLYYTHECPDLFRLGEWWYKVYSTFSERVVTHYRMSRTLSGPWLAPANDTFDGRAFYAAKTAGDGKRHFAFGWNPTRTDQSDTGGWNWGGSLVVHEIKQQLDGALAVSLPPEVAGLFKHPMTLTPQPKIGTWQNDAKSLHVDTQGGFAWSKLASLPEKASLIETTVQVTRETRGVGLVLRADDTLEHYFLLRVEPGRDRVIYERWPRPGDEPPIIERPFRFPVDGTFSLRVIVEGTIIVAYVNGEVALSTRSYEWSSGSVGLFVSEGVASFSNTTIRVTD